jgi:hypothetical protein
MNRAAREFFSRRLDPVQLAELGISELLHGNSVVEDRVGTALETLARTSDTRIHLIEDASTYEIKLNSHDRLYNLFEANDLDALVSPLNGTVALDITGFEHRVWAPLVSALRRSGKSFLVLYAEPGDYRKPEDLPGFIYDLSETRGIEPLPGFARLGRRANQALFVPLLGFEGARLEYLLDQEDIELQATYPIMGSPGFRIEYPMYTLLANRAILSQDYIHSRLELALASNPFDAYEALSRLHHRFGGNLRVAPIGTKPHALGAVLYALANQDAVELIYDHPKRSSGRTSGVGAIYSYDVSAFLRSMPPSP